MGNDFLLESGFAISMVIAIVLLVAMITFAFLGGKFDHVFKDKKQDDATIRANLSKALKRHATLKDIEVLENKTLSFGGETYTFDAIILSFYGTIAISSCLQQGQIFGEYKDEKWCAVDSKNTKTYFDNPMYALNGSVKFFKELYGTEKTKAGLSDAFVVFPAKETELYAGKRTEVYNLKNLDAKLNSEKYQADKGADISAMKAALEKYTVK